MAQPAPLLAQVVDLPDGVQASIVGEIDFSCSPDLRAQLLTLMRDKKPQRLILDLSGVPSMDSSGLATLVEVLQAQRRAGARLVLCGLQARVRGIFDIVRFNHIFTITEDAAKARTA